ARPGTRTNRSPSSQSVAVLRRPAVVIVATSSDAGAPSFGCSSRKASRAHEALPRLPPVLRRRQRFSTHSDEGMHAMSSWLRSARADDARRQSASQARSTFVTGSGTERVAIGSDRVRLIVGPHEGEQLLEVEVGKESAAPGSLVAVATELEDRE